MMNNSLLTSEQSEFINGLREYAKFIVKCDFYGKGMLFPFSNILFFLPNKHLVRAMSSLRSRLPPIWVQLVYASEPEFTSTEVTIPAKLEVYKWDVSVTKDFFTDVAGLKKYLDEVSKLPEPSFGRLESLAGASLYLQ